MNLKYFKEKVFSLFPNINSEILRIRWAQKQLGRISKGESIIDVGAGEMLFKKYCSHLRYTSQDLGKYNGRGDSRGLQTGVWDGSKVDIVSDITKIPVSGITFDNALCTAVLEHVPYPDLAIKEIARILKKGGKLILDAPFCSQTHFSPYFFSTGFSSNWYKLILPKYGFKIIKMIPYGNYFDYLSLELLRFPLVAKRYSVLGIMGFLLYLFTIPLIVITRIVSKLSGGSEKQLCFGYHVLATKI